MINLPTLPHVQRGFGAMTSAGTAPGTHIIRVVSTDPNEFWEALEFRPGEPKLILLTAEGEMHFEWQCPVNHPNITIDGRWAPGAGCIMTGERLKPQASQQKYIGIRHWGGGVPGPDADAVRVGPWSRRASDDHLTDFLYFLQCEFRGGKDETFGAMPRANGMSEGNRVSNMTLDRCLISDPLIVAGQKQHNYGTMFGDGVLKTTAIECVMHACKDRNPFVRGWADEIEILRCIISAFGNTAVDILAARPPRAIVHSNLFRFTRLSRQNRGPINLNSNPAIYSIDNWMDTTDPQVTLPGSIYAGEASRADAPLFAPSVDLETLGHGRDILGEVLGGAYAPCLGGFPNSEIVKVLEEVDRGDCYQWKGPAHLPMPAFSGERIDLDHTTGIPEFFKEWAPEITDLAQVIDEGPYAGLLAAEAVGDMLASQYYDTVPEGGGEPVPPPDPDPQPEPPDQSEHIARLEAENVRLRRALINIGDEVLGALDG